MGDLLRRGRYRPGADLAPLSRHRSGDQLPAIFVPAEEPVWQSRSGPAGGGAG